LGFIGAFLRKPQPLILSKILSRISEDVIIETKSLFIQGIWLSHGFAALPGINIALINLLEQRRGNFCEAEHAAQVHT
jgi:hypothetical protein